MEGGEEVRSIQDNILTSYIGDNMPENIPTKEVKSSQGFKMGDG